MKIRHGKKEIVVDSSFFVESTSILDLKNNLLENLIQEKVFGSVQCLVSANCVVAFDL